METLEALESAEGKGARSLVIGLAGERLSRIATIQTGSSSAAGQGGFGGVMGSKKLKAISVVGTGRVSLAAPETITSLARVLARRFKEAGRNKLFGFGGDLEALNQELIAEGNGRARCEPCTEGCLTPCAAYFEDMPGAAFERKWSGSWFCVARVLYPGRERFPPRARAIFDWRLERRAAFEINVLSNRYGLNQFDLLGGVVPWLIACQREGTIAELNGQAMDWDSPTFWAKFLHAIAYRQGLGDVLAEGGWIAAQTLRAGMDMARRQYAGWGHTGHWDGHMAGALPFPHWLVSTLQWLSDTRDPFNSGHGSLWPNRANGRAFGLDAGQEREAALDRIRAIGQRLYGSADAVDPYGGYGGKASMGRFHTVLPVILDCVPVDDMRFPVIYDHQAPDGCWRFDVDGLGEIEGPSVEYHLYRAGTGLDWPEAEFERAAERVVTMERALQVRHWGRDRHLDETILPYFERPETSKSPFLEKRYGLNREQFAPVLDEFYALHGWDPQSGWPTHERLVELDIGEVYGPMVEGAAKLDEHKPGFSDRGLDRGRSLVVHPGP
jgi:aldehyde:ferredoxin oxidoreductase